LVWEGVVAQVVFFLPGIGCASGAGILVDGTMCMAVLQHVNHNT
jgi:hypothetical protein